MAVEETVDAVPGAVITPEAGETLPPPATAAAKRQRQKDESTYVLQVGYMVDSGEGESSTTELAWFDAAKVTVPAGTKRATVRQRALDEAQILPPLGAPPMPTRLLDEDSWEETPVDSHLQLRIGGAS